jgi:hypothetical protein
MVRDKSNKNLFTFISFFTSISHKLKFKPMPFTSAMGKGMSQPSEWISVGSLLFKLGNCDIHAN